MLSNLRVPHHIIPLSDDQLLELCAFNRELAIERNAQGDLIIMSPADGLTGIRRARMVYELGKWNDQDESGYVFNSSSGFLLKDGSMLSPDVSWISKERWEAIPLEKQEKFAPVCPDFIIELRSPSDELKYVTEKMKVWIKNGCQLAWFIDPSQKKAFAYYPDQSIKEYSFTDSLSGEQLLPGFTLSLAKLK